MSSTRAPHALGPHSENRILAALPKDEYARLLPALSYARLPQGKVLWDVGDTVRHAYFPLGGMLSLLSVTDDGSTVEVGMMGGEVTTVRDERGRQRKLTADALGKLYKVDWSGTGTGA